MVRSYGVPIFRINTDIVRTLLHFISSPENEMLKMSYCDWSVSVMHHPSCGVKRLLLLNPGSL